MITCIAPAKVNLMLHVVDRLANGYHRLQSLITFVDVGDDLQVSPHTTDVLTLSGPFASLLEGDKNNSVLKAKEFFYTYFQIPISYFLIHLKKNLPIASGIGGGTSDAAAMLALLIQFHDLNLSIEEEEKIVQASGVLGADVPVCLAFQLGLGKLFWLDGAGVEELPQSIGLPQPLYFILINPMVPVDTRLIFQHMKPPFSSLSSLPHFSSHQSFLEFLATSKNDMEEVTHQCHALPDFSFLEKEGVLVRQSGSGATVFVLTETAYKAKALQEKLLAQYPSWWIKIGKTF